MKKRKKHLFIKVCTINILSDLNSSTARLQLERLYSYFGESTVPD